MSNELSDIEIQEMLNQYPLGHIDSPTDLRDYTYDMISEVSNVEIPNEFELEYQFKPKNQGQIGACVNHAISEVKEMIDNVSEYYSQWWLHALRDITDYQGKGAIIREELKHLVNDGIVPLNMFNVAEDYSQIKDILETKYDKNLLLQEANKHKSTGYITLQTGEIKKYLYTEKKPVIFAVKVYQNFYQASYNNGIIPSTPVGTNSYGNHCMVVVGYKDNMLKILNSWGDWGGQNGYLYLDINSPIIKELWGLTDKPIIKPLVKKYRTGWDKNSNGKWIYSKDGETLITNDWLQWNGKWYFLGKDSTMQIEWYKDSKGKWFYLDIDKGYAYCNCWVFIHNKWYHFDENCVMQTGWLQDGDKWFYLDIDKGYCYTNCTTLIDGKNYTFNNSGAWVQDNGSNLVSDDCISFVKGYEKFYSYKYDDGTGTITQGYGAVGNEIANWGDTITEEEASEELKTAINANYAKPIKEDLDGKGVSLSQPQQDSLYSCAYNIGVSSLLNSTLYHYICNGGRDDNTIQSYFCMWSKATINGVSTTMSGLYKRRVAESNIFNYGTYDSTH